MQIGLIGAGRIGVMHARNLAALEGLASLRIADVDPGRAKAVADELGASAADSVEQLISSGIDGLLIAAGTGAHAALIRAGVDAGIPVFCEKPVGPDVPSSLPVLAHIRERGGVVQIGHQRRFDAGFLEAKRAFDAGELGWLHSLRAVTADQAPPPIEFIATSGGLFRDCSVHDFDIIRWITGREIVEVYSRGSNNGDPAIGQAGDVDTALAVATLDDGTVATVTASRYNGAGHDVRLELQGSKASLLVGMDDTFAMRSAQPGVAFPAGPSHLTFAERFAAAYQAEVRAFAELIRGERENPCTPEDAVAASVVADAAQESLERGIAVSVHSELPDSSSVT